MRLASSVASELAPVAAGVGEGGAATAIVDVGKRTDDAGGALCSISDSVAMGAEAAGRPELVGRSLAQDQRMASEPKASNPTANLDSVGTGERDDKKFLR